MNFGRPISIPESFIRVDLPQVIQESQSLLPDNDGMGEGTASIEFFRASM
jgi:hypothetical protein